jgi:hypothetical protein
MPERQPIVQPAKNLGQQEDARRTVGELETLLKGVSFSYTAGTMLSELFS